jgi:TatD DNase family protein
MSVKPVIVDSHCHLDCLKGGDSIEGVGEYLDRAAERGVEHFLCVSIDWEKYPAVKALAEHYPQISCSVGVHPNHDEGYEPTVDDLLQQAKNPNVVAIGETGLDYFRSEGDLTWQQDRFRNHIRAARQCNKPLIIHTREAREDTLKILAEENAHECGGVMHCFTESWEMAQAAIDMNFYISFSGIVTFKTAVELQEVAKKVPLDRMLIETDSPYLAPVPHRGKQNEPAYVSHVAEFIAQLRGESVEDIARITTENFYTLFNGAKH